MNLKVILQRVEEHLHHRSTSGLDPTLSTSEVKTLEAINRSYKQINYLIGGNKRAFPWMTKSGKFTTVAEFTTGTVTATNGDKTIAHSATGFTDAMVGRKFKTAEDDTIYTIAYRASTSSLELDQDYVGTGGSGLSFRIYEDTYDLPADFQELISITSPISPSKGLKQIPASEMYGEKWRLAPSTPTEYTIMPTNSKDDSVTAITGTNTTFTDGSRTVSGSGTSFSSQLKPGDLIRANNSHVDGTESGTLWRIVESIASDTSLTLTQYWGGTTATSSNGRKLDSWMKVTLSPPPKDAKVYTVTYIRALTDLYDMRNVPEMPDYYHQSLIHGALADRYQEEDDERSDNEYLKFELWKNRLKMDFGLTAGSLRMVPRVA